MNDSGQLAMGRQFDGSDYDHARDSVRLTRQIDRILALMLDGRWRTVEEVARATGCSQTSASAQLRNLRKPEHGSLLVERRRCESGLYQYRVQRREERRVQLDLFRLELPR